MKTSMMGLMVLLAIGGCSSGDDGGGSGGGGSNLSGCAKLCAHTDTATSSQVDCVAAQSIAKGYNWPADPVCSTIANEGQCNTCTVNVAMTAGDCEAVEASCF
jgi:hypothetical protein